MTRRAGAAAAKRETDSRQHQPQAREAKIALEGPATLEVEPLEVVEGPRFKDREKELAFNEDMLTIIIHPSTEKNAERVILVAVNGRNCYIPRNLEVKVRRKYVERLAHARQENIEQDVTAKDPADVNRLNITQAHKYPFSVLHDPHPDGAAWLRKVCSE